MDRLAYLDQAMTLLNEALELSPGYWPARFALAMTAFSAPPFLGLTDEAIRNFEILIAEGGQGIESVLLQAYLNLGEALLRAGREEEAMGRWREGLERFPDDEALARKVSGGEEDDPVPFEPAPDPGGPEPVYALEPITVEAGSFALGDPRAGIPVTSTAVYNTPGGAADVLQAFQTMPGVTRMSEGSDLYVRGGDAAETAVFVDGVRVHEAGMFERLDGSLFGILDPAVLRRAYFSSGGFSVRYGDALSGVLDAETVGIPPVESWRLGANVVSLGGTLRRHLGEGGGAWASATATDVRALLALQGREEEYPRSPRAGQITAGIAFLGDDGTELRTTALGVWDRSDKLIRALGYQGTFTGSNGTTMVATRFLRALASGGSLTVSGGATRRTTGFRLGVLDRHRTDDALEVRAAAQREDGHSWLRVGSEARYLRSAERGTVPTVEAFAPGSPSQALPGRPVGHSHVGGYVEGGARPADKVAFTAGMRVDRLPGESGWTADPRVSAAFEHGGWTVRSGVGVFHQSRLRVRYQEPDGGSPSGTARRARHLALGLERDGRWPVRVEIYEKRYDRYAPDGALGPMAVAGSARGVDVIVRRPVGGIRGWISYSFLHRRATLADGRVVPANTDVTHSASVVATGWLNERWELGGTGRFASGRPFTPVEGPRSSPEPRATTSPDYGAPNSDRMPAYVRLDGRLTHYRSVRGGLLVIYLEALNLLARRNLMSYQYDGDYAHRYAVETFFAERTLILGVEARF
jgi:tetratricopeptide (TPR) repeat protein